MVRHIKAPLKIPAVLPHGPMQQQAVEFDALVENANSMEQNYSTLAERTTTMLLGLMGGDSQEGASNATKWEEGPKFVWKNVANPAATDAARSTPVSRAWRNTTAWLRVVQANRSTVLARNAVWKLIHYDHRLQVDDTQMRE